MAKLVERTRNGGTLTEAAFKTMIISALREKSRWWKPKQKCIKDARVSKGKYRCASCRQIVPSTIKGVYKTGKRAGKPRKIVNILADHIEPVVDPYVGFVSWDVYIERMFIETGFQAICHSCHQEKSLTEKDIRTERMRKEKNEAN